MSRIPIASCLKVLGLAAALAVAPGPGLAGTAGNVFQVKVRLGEEPLSPTPNPPGTGDFCRSVTPGSFGAIVTVVCRTGVVVELAPSRPGDPGAAVHGGAYRFHPPVAFVEPGSASDQSTGAGTVTSWRVVHLADRSYVEMTVRW